MDFRDDRSTTMGASNPQLFRSNSRPSEHVMLDRKISQIETIVQMHADVTKRMLEDFNTRMLEKMRQLRKLALGDQDESSALRTNDRPSFSVSDVAMTRRPSEGDPAGNGHVQGGSVQPHARQSAAITPPSDAAHASDEDAPAPRRRAMAKRGNRNGLGTTPRGRDAAPLPSTQEDELFLAQERKAKRVLAARPSKRKLPRTGGSTMPTADSEDDVPMTDTRGSTTMAPPPVADSQPASQATGDRNREENGLTTKTPLDRPAASHVMELSDDTDSEPDGFEYETALPDDPPADPPHGARAAPIDDDVASDPDYEPSLRSPRDPINFSTQSVRASAERLWDPITARDAAPPATASASTTTDPPAAAAGAAPVAPMTTASGTLAAGATAPPLKKRGGARPGAGRKPGGKNAAAPAAPATPATTTPSRRGGARPGAGRSRGGGGVGSGGGSARKADRLLAQTPEWEQIDFDRDEYVARLEREAAAKRGSSTRGPFPLGAVLDAAGGSGGGESPGSAAKRKGVGEPVGAGSAKKRAG